MDRVRQRSLHTVCVGNRLESLVLKVERVRLKPPATTGSKSKTARANRTVLQKQAKNQQEVLRETGHRLPRIHMEERRDRKSGIRSNAETGFPGR